MKLSKNLGIVAFLVLLCLVPVFLKNIYWIHVVILIFITILLTYSLRAINRTGNLSLGTAGFMLVGAYGSALLTMRIGIPFWISLPLGGLLCAVLALAVGYPFLRVPGEHFIFLTLLLGVVIQYFAGYWDTLTGGWNGLRDIPPPNPLAIPGIGTISFETDSAYYYLSLIIIALSLFILYRMEHSRIGLVWGAIRETHNLAQSVGINIVRHKVFIFSVACFFTGIAGGLYAFYVHSLSPATSPGSTFAVYTSIYITLYMVVGGQESFAGPIIGTVVLMLIPELARPLQEYRPFLNGIILILVVFLMPKGLVYLGDYFVIWYRRSLGRLKR